MNVAIKEPLVCDLGSAVLTKPTYHFQLITIPFCDRLRFDRLAARAAAAASVPLWHAGQIWWIGWMGAGGARRLIEKVVGQQLGAL